MRITSNRQRDTTITDLFDHNNNNWKQEDISNLIGNQAVRLILSSAKIPNPSAILNDRLIWDGSKSGKYSTKEGYLILQELHHQPPEYGDMKIKAWKMIWSWKLVLPKIKTFLWRGIHGGLAKALDMHKRIHAIDPKCQRCATGNESLTHLLFNCPLSRSTWFASEFALRTYQIPLKFTEVLMELMESLDEQQVTVVRAIIFYVYLTNL